MVEKFNFYDIYGYLLPGLVFIGLACLPFGLLFGIWPKAEISSAILVLVMAYVLGHLVQSFATKFTPSKIKDSFGQWRFPSDLILDPSDKTFTDTTKKRIAERCQKYFCLEIELERDLGDLGQARKQLADQLRKIESEQKSAKQELTKGNAGTDYLPAEIATRENDIRKKRLLLKALTAVIEQNRSQRGDAFYLARSALLKGKSTSYWEQFEGLYAFMRNVSFSLFAAALLYLGWSADPSLWSSGLRPSHYLLITVLVLIIIVLFRADRLSTAKPSTYDAQKLEKLVRTDNTGGEHSQVSRGRFSFLWAERPHLFVLQITLGLALCSGGWFVGRSIGPPAPQLTKSSGFHIALIANVLPSTAESKDAPSLHFEIEPRGFFLLILALILTAASVRCHGAYRLFSKEFAVNVWRGFANIDSPKPDELHM